MAFDEALGNQNMVFVVPRGHDRLVLGGLVEPGAWSTELTLDNYPPINDMLYRCQKFLPALQDIELLPGNPVHTGLRPYRQRNVRVEQEPNTAVIHNIGHGGSGFTFSWGCAEDSINLVDQLLHEKMALALT